MRSAATGSAGGGPRVVAPRVAALPTWSHARYVALLGALFVLFNFARIVAYLPTIWAVAVTGDSSQHSLWTWGTFFGGNATLAAWLWEENARRPNRAIIGSAANALMCLAIIGVIAWTRI